MLVATLALTLAQQRFTLAPLTAFKGSRWGGLEIGVTEKELKAKFATTKTVIADPASVRVLSDPDGWTVSALVSSPGGKGSVVGFALERPNRPMPLISDLELELGPADTKIFPRYRTEDWWVVGWSQRGILAAIDPGSPDAVQRVVMASPETVQANLRDWTIESTPLSEFPRVPVGEIEVRPTIALNDRKVELALHGQMHRVAALMMKEYRGVGWRTDLASPDRIVIEARIRRIRNGEIETRLESRFVSDGGAYLNMAAQHAVSDIHADPVTAGLRLEGLMRGAVAVVGERMHERLKRDTWQRELRPFYSLARPQ